MEKYKKETICVKCGGNLAFDTYREISPSALVDKTKEVIERKCANCKYSWYETPLDFKGDKMIEEKDEGTVMRMKP